MTPHTEILLIYSSPQPSREVALYAAAHEAGGFRIFFALAVTACGRRQGGVAIEVLRRLESGE